MIRKIFILLLVVFLFIYTAWNFYTKALVYDPLSEISIRKMKGKDPEMVSSSKVSSGWSKAIEEKNLFSAIRTFKEPKPVIIAPPVIEPPKRPELTLKGIVLDTFGDYVAYIDIDKAASMPMRKGDKTADVELVDISERNVVLKWNNETINLGIDRIKTIRNPRSTK